VADQPIKKVKAEAEMDSETFLKHMNARHVGAAGIQHFGKSNVPGDSDENLLRAWHSILHGDTSSAQQGLDHTHIEESSE
jgi:hypothetical protein